MPINNLVDTSLAESRLQDLLVKAGLTHTDAMADLATLIFARKERDKLCDAEGRSAAPELFMGKSAEQWWMDTGKLRAESADIGVAAQKDADRLEWVLRKISGAELRRIGVVMSSGGLDSGRVAIDGAMASEMSAIEPKKHPKP